MTGGRALETLRRAVESLRLEYLVAGRGAEFDAYVERLRSEGRWPFDEPGADAGRPQAPPSTLLRPSRAPGTSA